MRLLILTLGLGLMTLLPISAQPQNPKKVNPIPTGKEKKQDTNQSVTNPPIVKKNPTPYDLIPVSDTLKIPILDFKNTDIRDVLRAVGMQYNVNIYLEPEVKGNISLYLVDISVKDAVDFIVKRKGYSYEVKNNIVKVFKPQDRPKPPPPRPKVVFKVENGLLTVDFKDLTVGEVIRLFIDSASINVVQEYPSQNKLTTRLAKVDLHKAVNIIFSSNGFDVSVKDNIYYIAEQTWGDDKKSGTKGRKKRMNIQVSKDLKVTLEVTNAPLDDLVRNIVLESKLNIVVYEKITGTISAKCDSTPIDDILRFLLQNTKFTFWKDKNIYFIGSREMSQQKTTAIVPLKHIRAEEAEIAKFLPPKISKDAIIKYDNVHNSVIIIGSFDIVAQARDFILAIDKPIPQVLIEALVVEFNLNKIRSYGVSIFTGGLNDTSGNWMSEQFLPTLHLKPGRLKTAHIINDVLRHLGAKRIIELPKNFRSSIQALEAADVVKVHSTPQIATINGNPASITIGETRYYKLSKETKSTTSNQNTNVIGTDERFVEKKFNTKLEVTPWVMADGYVMVDIRPEFNIPRSGGDLDRPPTIDTRVIKSMVRLRNGQTIVLGGQRQTENVVNSKGIPFLSSIPILGWVFSSKTITKNETQMMIFLTPHVYYGDEGVVSPDDFFGNELNKMLEKHDPETKRKLRKEKKEKRRQEKKAVAQFKQDQSGTMINNQQIQDDQEVLPEDKGIGILTDPKGLKKTKKAKQEKPILKSEDSTQSPKIQAEDTLGQQPGEQTPDKEKTRKKKKRKWRLFQRIKEKNRENPENQKKVDDQETIHDNSAEEKNPELEIDSTFSEDPEERKPVKKKKKRRRWFKKKSSKDEKNEPKKTKEEISD